MFNNIFVVIFDIYGTDNVEKKFKRLMVVKIAEIKIDLYQNLT